MAAICFQNSRSLSARRVQGRRSSDTTADAGLEIAPHAGLYLLRPTIGLEALQVEAQDLRTLPEVGIVDMAVLGIDRVDHLEEACLRSGCLRRGVQGGRTWVLARYREVAEDDPCRALAERRPGGGAVGAAEIGVDDQQLALAADVVVRARWRDRGAGELAVQASTDASASKIRFAPGISSGVGDSCTHSTVPSSSIKTSERLAWPVASM